MKKSIQQKKEHADFVSINLPLYRRHVIVAINADSKSIIDYGRTHGMDEEVLTNDWCENLRKTDDDGCQGFCQHFGDNNNDVLVSIRKMPETLPQLGCLLHELYHAVDLMAHQMDEGCAFTGGSGVSEPRAYLYEHVVMETIGSLELFPNLKKMRPKHFHKV